MPRAFAFSSNLRKKFKVLLAVLCLTGLSAVDTLALVPCAAPLKPGFRTRTYFLDGIAYNGDPASIAPGDFNNDGFTDALVPMGNFNFPLENQLFRFLGNSNGLALMGTNTIMRNPTESAVTDFNADGKLDLLIANFTTIQTLVGDGMGGFNQVASYTITGSGSGTALAVGDFNSDGKQDFASAVFTTPGRVSIYNGFGTGTYAAPVDTPTGNDPRDIKAADMNGDGKLDLLTVNPTNGVSVLLNNGSGAFSLPTHFATGLNLPSSIAVADFNNDSKLDVAVSNWTFSGQVSNPPSLAILLGNGMGGLGTATTINRQVNYREMLAGDFTGDGKADLAALTSIQVPGIGTSPDNVELLAGDGAGGFNFIGSTGVGHSGRSIAAG
ncbi:MAG: VCBS repeat-containing protein, partial [Acidobacteria bacterium]|nr:VCBS repeat-containing protein [Acidobacteriota bacterium]